MGFFLLQKSLNLSVNQGESEIQLILRLRRENPTYGKAKIAVILQRDFGICLSESTVGRILKHLMTKGLIQKSLSAPRQKRRRSFQKHAQPWKYGMQALNPGQMVQIDHMSVSVNQITIKHFHGLGSEVQVYSGLCGF